MYAQFDILCPETGRVLLSTLFDAPPHGIKKTDVATLLRVLSRTKKDLESVFGTGQVRVSLDSYEGSVFWYLVLFRPLWFSHHHKVFGDRRYSAYDILTKGAGEDLQKTDLGLVYDRENHWLVLIWPVAESGVLGEMDKCPSWGRILGEYEKRLGVEPKMDWWKRCAESHSWVIPPATLHNMHYKQNKLWFHKGLRYSEITVLNLRGIEPLRLEGEGKGLLNEVKLTVARRVRYAFHYTLDKREYKRVAHMIKRLDHGDNSVIHERSIQPTLERRKKAGLNPDGTPGRQVPWVEASCVISKIPKALGVVIKGRRKRMLTGEDSDRFFSICEDAFTNSKWKARRKGKELHRLLDELDKWVGDNVVPPEYKRWAVWRERVPDHRKVSNECAK